MLRWIAAGLSSVGVGLAAGEGVVWVPKGRIALVHCPDDLLDRPTLAESGLSLAYTFRAGRVYPRRFVLLSREGTAVVPSLVLWSDDPLKSHEIRVEATFAIDHAMLQASEPSALQRLLRQLEVADQRREPRSRWRAATVMSADRAMEILVAREIHDSQFWDDAGSRSRESIRASIADTLALLSIRLNTMNVTTPSAYTLPENWHLVKDHQGHVFFKNIVTGVESDTRPETPQR